MNKEVIEKKKQKDASRNCVNLNVCELWKKAESQKDYCSKCGCYAAFTETIDIGQIGISEFDEESYWLTNFITGEGMQIKKEVLAKLLMDFFNEEF